MKNRLILAAVGTAFFLGLVGFTSLTPPGDAPLELLPALYHALGLFVMNPGPFGLPSGDPLWALVVLWAAHFLAPLSLASFLVDAALALVKGRERSFRNKEGHTIVCGLGRTAVLAVEEILQRASPRNVVVVELFPDCPQLPSVRERGVQVVLGSMEEEVVLRRAGVEKAHRFLAFANNDILNINAAATARRLNRTNRFVAGAQVADAKLARNLPASLKKEIRFINTHEIAADALVRDRRLTHGYEDAYVVAGFGNFGQQVLKALLQEEETSRGDRHFVLDRDAEEKIRIFLETFGFEDRDVRPVQGNLHDPLLWRSLKEVLSAERPSGRDPIVLVCTDNDVSNLSLALNIRRLYIKESVIYCRLFGEVSFEEEMTKGHKIETYRVADLLRKNLPPEFLARERH